MTTNFASMKLENKWNDAVREMVQAKIAGKEIVAIEEVEPEVVDIMTALKKSIEQAKDKKKPMEKVTSEKAVAKEKKTAKSKATAKTKAKTKARKTA